MDPLKEKFYQKSVALKADLKSIVGPSILFNNDTIINARKQYLITITPNRKVNRYDIFANEKLTIQNLMVKNATNLSTSFTK